MSAAPRVDSEVGRLRTVLVHRPGDELAHVDPEHPEAALFGAAMDAAQAAAEHDALTAALRDGGAEVLEVAALAADVLGTGDARRAIGAMPNLLYTRDPAFWVGDGWVAGEMATGQRHDEPELLARVFTEHPRLAETSRSWTPAGAPRPVVEGGDVLVPAAGRVAVGVGERTTEAGARALAEALLEGGGATELLTLRVPAGAGFHLDLVLTALDVDAFAVWAPVRDRLQAHVWRWTPSGVTPSAIDDAYRWLAGGHAAQLVEIAAEPDGHGRPWDHGCNVVALAPRTVVAYADNVRANARLEAAGVTVVAVPGAALAAGRGGPRCLTCPVSRDPL
ncbi:arginine deiminase family protein [Conexibacter sp. SYSU D00693]|uniref:arginine deiminase family protein n=1 Tax=Conexibacter sp. SYSU D00693 TaxID=2812560 RepID=UPI00196AC178|nr:arginine deiminase family protein [Conexibacter sp. SYSU D00693]